MWTCAICKAQHSSLPLCFGADAPWRALAPEAEFDERVELTADQCVVDGEHFFVRGHIELPIIDTTDTFAWSVWCSLSEKSFRDMTERWEDPLRDGDGYFGCATGFGDLRPCDTLGSLLDVASTAASAVDWLDSPERAGLRSRHFKLPTLRPASSERPSRPRR